ncbi:hypothetical protein [Lysobacter gummosus]|uniref:hypothetical protein n=1 Tax=Lysobacter gummosus TaxID=262324 RepID=UPI003640A29F
MEAAGQRQRQQRRRPYRHLEHHLLIARRVASVAVRRRGQHLANTFATPALCRGFSCGPARRLLARSPCRGGDVRLGLV